MSERILDAQENIASGDCSELSFQVHLRGISCFLARICQKFDWKAEVEGNPIMSQLGLRQHPDPLQAP